MFKRSLALIALLVVALSAAYAAVPRAAQKPPAARAAAIPRTADGKPDFSGMWDNPKPASGPLRGPATIFDKSKFPAFKPGGEAFYEPRTGDPRKDEPRAFCMPSGFPSAFLGPYPVQMIQNAKHLVMITEFMRVARIIPLDGRPHQDDIEPTYYGDPVGKWEGDTLVIDTTRFKRWSLDDNYYGNPKEYRMHSDQIRFHGGRPQDLHRVVDRELGIQTAPGVGEDGSLRDGLPGEQPLPRREVRQRIVARATHDYLSARNAESSTHFRYSVAACLASIWPIVSPRSRTSSLARQPWARATFSST
jgi:hypothetical protein